MTFMYSEPRSIRIRFHRRFSSVWAKIRIIRRWLFRAWHHLCTEISGENYLNRTHLRPNSRLSQKQNEFIKIYTMVHQTSNRHIQLVIRNLKFIILHDLATKESGILDWRRYFCDWSISSHFIWKVMPSRHVTEYNTRRDNVVHKHTQLWSIDWNRGTATSACRECYVQHDKPCPCVTQ